LKHDTSLNKWYGTCAVSTTGVSMKGTGVGVEEIHAVLLINDENFFPFLLQNSPNASDTTNKTVVGTDMTIVVGKVHDNYMVSSLPKIMSFSFSKGVNVDFAFEKIAIIVNNKINKDFYQATVNGEDIFNSKIKPIDNKNYFELCNQLTSCANVRNEKKHIIYQHRRFELSKNTPLYQYYMGNNKNIEYNYHQLSQLPSLPFINDVKNKKYSLINTKGWLLGKKIFRGFKKLFHFQNESNKNEDNKAKSKRFVFDANMPLYQYYTTGEFIKYDSKQLNALPKFPFVDDVRSYHNFDFWKSYFVKDTKKVHHEKHKKYVFDELTPLYQYYNYNENLNEVKYNCKILSKLPKFPFSDDIKSNKFHLKQYNPIYIIKKKIKTHQDHERKVNEKSVEKQWHFDANVPLYQYYMNPTEVKIYDTKQLSALPTFPFMNDVKTKKYKLQSFDPISFVKTAYIKYIATSSKKL